MAAPLLTGPKLWPQHERHVRHAGWTELFYDLVFAAAISQLSGPLDGDYTASGLLRYTFLLSLIFLAWLGYAYLSTVVATDDLLERILVLAQIFFVAVMAANATDSLGSRDAAGFGAAYGGVRLVLALQYFRVRRLPGLKDLARRRIAGLIISASLWCGSALVIAPGRFWVWALAFMIDVWNSWPPAHSTMTLSPGATHFPERFGLLTIILLGEFVASVMRGIQSHMDWSVLAASAAILSLVIGFAVWSAYSDGAAAWETRHIRTESDVWRLRLWIGFHFLLFLGVGVLAVGVRRAIALPAGGYFEPREQAIVCLAVAGILFTIAMLAITSRRPQLAEVSRFRASTVFALCAVTTLSLVFLFQLNAAAALLCFLVCFCLQIAALILDRHTQRGIAEI